MSLIGAKPSVSEDVIRYQARTKLASLGGEIIALRNLNSPEAKAKIKQATMIRLWLKALDYKAYLSRTQREKIWYALIDIADINNFPVAPILELRARPDILSGGITINTTTSSSSSSTGGNNEISFTNSDVDTGTEVVDSFARTFSTGAQWTYTARKNDNSGQKSGRIIATWLPDGSSVSFEEDSTIFVGAAGGDVDLTVVHTAGNIELRATVISDNWTVEGFRQHIPSSSGISTSNNLPVNQIIVGSALNIATPVAMSQDATIVSSGAITVSQISESTGEKLKFKTLNIVDWDMNSSFSKSVLHGIADADFSKIRVLYVTIFPDGGANPPSPLNNLDRVTGKTNGGVYAIFTDGGGGIVLHRTDGGYYNNTSFDQVAGYVRGKILIAYE